MNTQSKSIDKEVLEITKTPWIAEWTHSINGGQKLGWFISDRENTELHITLNADSGKAEANAKAICKAINGTYGKGYNPDAVEELYKALQILLISHYQLTGGTKRTEVEEIAEKALKNAKITN